MTVWDDIFGSRSWGRWPAEEVVRAVSRLANNAGRPLTVCEVGCGPGAQLRYLGEEGHVAIGVDLAAVGLRQAAHRLAERGLGTRLVLGDGRRLPLRDACLDVVLDVEAFSCLDEVDVPAAWAEATRVLTRGGHLVTVAFTPRTTGIMSGRALGRRTFTDTPAGPFQGIGTVNVTSARDLEGLAAGAGLSLIDVQYRSRTFGPDHELIEELVAIARRSE